jgi:hypothetical protein
VVVEEAWWASRRSRMARDWVRARSAAARTDCREGEVTRGVDWVILGGMVVVVVLFGVIDAIVVALEAPHFIDPNPSACLHNTDRAVPSSEDVTLAGDDRWVVGFL